MRAFSQHGGWACFSWRWWKCLLILQLLLPRPPAMRTPSISLRFPLQSPPDIPDQRSELLWLLHIIPDRRSEFLRLLQGLLWGDAGRRATPAALPEDPPPAPAGTDSTPPFLFT